MKRAVLSLLLISGHVFGFLLVWIGIEMLTIEPAGPAPALVAIAAGVGLWAGLAALTRPGPWVASPRGGRR